MAQHDYIIANQSGAAFRADLNNGLAAIVSQNSGVAQPSTTYAYQWWADTTTGLLKLRNAANNAWITIGTLADANLGLLSLAGGTLTGALLVDDSGTAALPAIAFDGDPDTGAFRAGANEFGIATNGVERVEFGTSEVVFNDGGANYDFRIEGDTNASLFKIDAGLDEVQVANLNGGPLAGTRNRIINGDMRIDQRNAGAALNNAANGSLAVDRWVRYQNVGASNIGRNLNSITPPAGFTNYLGIQISTAGTATASQYTNFQQSVEGFNAADFAWGTASAQSVTISFWVRSSLTGSQGFALQNAAAALGYSFTATINTANTWEYKTVTIPGVTTGTWDTTNGRGITLIVDLGMGSNFRFTSGSWQSANVQGATGALNLNQTLNATFYITGVQLEPGTVATPFERRSYGQELSLCQRYFQRGVYRLSGVCNGAGGDASIVFPTPFRSSPTLTVNTLGAFVDGLATINITALTLSSTQETSSRIAVSAASSTAGRGMVFDGSNLSFSAEL
jgi:hypothetical protein